MNRIKSTKIFFATLFGGGGAWPLLAPLPPPLIATTRGPGTLASGRAKAAGAVKLMMSFDFVFILHVMKELMVSQTSSAKSYSKNPRTLSMLWIMLPLLKS